MSRRAAIALVSLSLFTACQALPLAPTPVEADPRPPELAAVVPGADVDLLPPEPATEPLPQGAVMRLGTTGLAHALEIHHVALSPDGKLGWSSAIYDHAPMIWETDTGRSRGRLPLAGDASSVEGLAVSPDGAALAVASADHVAIVDPLTGAQRARVDGKDIVAVAWSPDGARLAVGHREGRVDLADARTGKVIKTVRGRDEMFDAVAFSPDGTRLAAAGGADSAVYVWDAKSGKQLMKWSASGSGYNNGIAWLPEGSLALAVGDKRIVIFAAGAKEPTASWPMPSAISSLGASADGKLVVATFDSRVALVDPSTGAVVKDLVGGQAAPSRNKSYANALVVAGGRVITGWESGLVRVFDLADGAETARLAGHRARVDAVAWSGDGRFIATGGEDGATILWRAGNGRQWRVLDPEPRGTQGAVNDIAIQPNGMLVVVALGNNELDVWDAATGELRKRLTLPAKPNALAWSPGGTHLALGLANGEAHVLDASTWEATFTGGHGGSSILSVAFAGSDDRLVVTLANTLVLWDVAAVKVLGDRKRKGPRSTMDALALGPDGKHAWTGGYNGAVDRWDLSAPAEAEPVSSVRQLGEADGASNPVTALVALPGGGFVSGGTRGDLLVIGPGDVQRAHYPGHSAEVTDLAIAPDGKHAASASTDMSVLIWKL